MNHQPAYYSVYRTRFEFRKSRTLIEGSTTGIVYACIYVEGQPPELQTTGIRCTHAD